MRVKIYDIDNSGTQRFRSEAPLTDCFDPDDPELGTAQAELQKAGRYWTGGGAAPLTLLMRVS